jgi:hypothetical protein
MARAAPVAIGIALGLAAVGAGWLWWRYGLATLVDAVVAYCL